MSSIPGTPAAPAEPPKQDVAGNNNVAGETAGVAAAETLPFTGISLLSSAVIGAMLLALGLILRRRERPPGATPPPSQTLHRQSAGLEATESRLLLVAHCGR